MLYPYFKDERLATISHKTLYRFINCPSDILVKLNQLKEKILDSKFSDVCYPQNTYRFEKKYLEQIVNADNPNAMLKTVQTFENNFVQLAISLWETKKQHSKISGAKEYCDDHMSQLFKFFVTNGLFEQVLACKNQSQVLELASLLLHENLNDCIADVIANAEKAPQLLEWIKQDNQNNEKKVEKENESYLDFIKSIRRELDYHQNFAKPNLSLHYLLIKHADMSEDILQLRQIKFRDSIRCIDLELTTPQIVAFVQKNKDHPHWEQMKNAMTKYQGFYNLAVNNSDFLRLALEIVNQLKGDDFLKNNILEDFRRNIAIAPSMFRALKIVTVDWSTPLLEEDYYKIHHKIVDEVKFNSKLSLFHPIAEQLKRIISFPSIQKGIR